MLWAIRDAAGDVVGFGARRLFDDDRLEAKYINTSETPLYKKSQVLFGLDLAKRDISRQRRAVVVEGYTDVMAMHLAGVTTAVASCGTAFGDEHISVLRRYLLDSEVIRGEVVYTFDGDAAGQKAALKAFDSDQRFAANTYVAVAPAGMDPCELRLAKGDEAVQGAGGDPQPAVRVRHHAPRWTATTWTPPRAGWRPPPRRSRWWPGSRRAPCATSTSRQLAGWLGSELGTDPAAGAGLHRRCRPGGQADRRSGRGQDASRRLGTRHAERGSPAGRPGRSAAARPAVGRATVVRPAAG